MLWGPRAFSLRRLWVLVRAIPEAFEPVEDEPPPQSSSAEVRRFFGVGRNRR